MLDFLFEIGSWVRILTFRDRVPIFKISIDSEMTDLNSKMTDLNSEMTDLNLQIPRWDLNFSADAVNLPFQNTNLLSICIIIHICTPLFLGKPASCPISHSGNTSIKML